MPDISSVAEADALFQNRRSGAEQQLYVPFHAIHAVDVPDKHRVATVRILAKSEVHGRHAGPVMEDGKIELDTKSGPRSAITHRRCLDRGVVIEHRLPGDLVDARIKVSADVRHDRALQILVLQVDRTPPVVYSAAGKVFPQSIVN